MHGECMEWLNRVLPQEGNREGPRALWVLELGSRDVNGSPRSFFPLAVGGGRYVGVDISPGPGADIVADAADWRPADNRTKDKALLEVDGPGIPEKFDVVVCVEVLEHAVRWREIVRTAAACVKPGGLVAITAAGPARAEHSAVDGMALRPGEYYANVLKEHLEAELVEAGLKAVVVTYDRAEEDVRAVARGR